MAGNWRKNVREIAPYVPGEHSKDANLIKLNANENPYPPSHKVHEVFLNFDAAALRRYPDANSTELRHTLAEHFGVGDNQVFLGNGSDDVLALCFQTFFCSDEPILFPDVTYSFYPVWCSLFRIPLIRRITQFQMAVSSCPTPMHRPVSERAWSLWKRCFKTTRTVL